MPFAGFEDFDACVREMQEKEGYSEEKARKVCGKLQAEHEKEAAEPKKRVRKKVKKPVETPPVESEPFDADFDGTFMYPIVVEKSDHTYTLGPALVPDVIDKQGDVISAEDVEKAAHDWMAAGCPLNTMHTADVDAATAVAVESYILRVEQTIATRAYKKGTWMVGVKWFDPEIRKQIKAGNRRAYSIGGHGRATELTD